MEVRSGAMAVPGPNYLGDINEVVKIVGLFVSDVIAADDPSDDLCRKMARVFTGEEPGYTPLAAWNTRGLLDEPPRIAHYIAEQIQGLPHFPTAHETVTTAFGVLANRVLDVHDEEGDGPEWERRSANLVMMFSRILVGVPQLPGR